MIIGLTGNIACGKSTFAEVWRMLGCPVVDADAVCHKLYRTSDELKAKLSDEFGSDILSNNSVDRNKLGALIFNSPDKLPLLNSIVHPFITDEIHHQLLKYEKECGIVLYDAPLLVETGACERMDKTICVVTDDSIRKSRLMKRNQLTDSDAQRRMDAQLCQHIKSSKCNIVIKNNGSLDQLKLKASAVYNEILFPSI